MAVQNNRLKAKKANSLSSLFLSGISKKSYTKLLENHWYKQVNFTGF